MGQLIDGTGVSGQGAAAQTGQPGEDSRVPNATTGGGYALVLRNIRKSFDGVEALSGASLTCQRGEIRGLVGENGAGKSTFVKVLSGAIPADAGEIFLNGRRLQPRSPLDAQRVGIVTVFQELSLIPALTVASNLFYGIEPRVRGGRVDQRALRREAAAVLENLGQPGIDPAARVRDLPLAERQVLEISKALIRNPTVLILDEATSALLPDQVDWLFAKITEFAAAGNLALFISHRLEEVERLCNQVTVFRGGKDVGHGPIGEMPESRLTELMLGKKLDRVFPPAGTSQAAGEDVVCDVHHLASGSRLRDVSLQVRRGEILGVAGLAGQGQLDLFRSLFGAQHHTGQVIIEGKPVRLRRPDDALQAGIALIPEDRATEGLCLSLGIRDNISLSSLDSISTLGLIRAAKEHALVGSAITQLGIALRHPRQEASALSGGNQQKVLIARVLARRPRLLLMYDATRGIDVGTKTEIYKLMRDLCETGVSILFYSTDVFELSNLADRVIVLHDGEIRAHLTSDDITENRIVAASVGGLRNGQS